MNLATVSVISGAMTVLARLLTEFAKFCSLVSRSSKSSTIHSGGSPDPAPSTARVVNVASGITASAAIRSRNEVSGIEPMFSVDSKNDFSKSIFKSISEPIQPRTTTLAILPIIQRISTGASHDIFVIEISHFLVNEAIPMYLLATFG